MPSTGERSDREPIDCSLSEIISRFLAEQQAAGRSPATLHVYRRILGDLRSVLLEQIHSEDIRRINKELLAGFVQRIGAYTFGDEEKRAWVARVKIFFRWTCQNGIILFDPAASIKLAAAKKRRQPVYLTQSELTHFLNSVSTATAAGLRDRAILELLYSCGLRRAEVCGLTLADVNFADGTVRVLAGKGNKDRLVPIGNVALCWIDCYISQVHGLRLYEPLFYQPGSFQAIAGWYIGRIVSKYKSAAGLQKTCNVRTFRHSFAIHLLENGASVRHIQAMMGHASLKTTQKYLRIVPAELKRAHARAHPSNNRKWKLPDSAPLRLRKK